MTPDFALSLSYSGIALLQRAASSGGPAQGWYSLGEVALDVEDLSGALAVLREEAVPNADIDGPEVKLILPNEQVKYINVPFEGGDPIVAVEKALVGATPYPVSELVFDWRVSDGQLQIAAVAQETLDEAEAFANDNRFLPLGFAAIPDGTAFEGEPFFGPAQAAMTHLAPGVTVEGDATAISVLTGPAPGADTIVAVEAPEEPSEPDADRPTPEIDGSAVPTAAESQVVPAEDDVSEPEAPAELAAPQADILADGIANVEEEAATVADAAPPDDATPEDTPRTPDLSAPTDVPDPVKPLGEPMAEAEPPVSFASLRAEHAGGEAEIPAVAAPDPNAEGKTPGLSATRSASAEDAPAKAAGAQGSIAARLQAQATASLQQDDLEPATTQPDGASSDDTGSSSVTSVLARAQSGLGRGIGFVSRRTAELRASRNDPGEAPTPPQKRGGAAAALAGGNRMDEAQRMTMFGARRDAKKVEVGGKPRFLGLMLTAALLVVLLGVAAWASIFVDEGLARFFPGRNAEQPATETALSQPVAPAIEETAPEATPDTPTLALPQAPEANPDDVSVASLTPGLPAPAQDSELGNDTLGLTRPLGYEALTPEEAEARYAATGIWQRAPIPPADLRPGILEDFYIASIDPNVTQQDAVALPPASDLLADQGISPQELPPTADQRYDFDERGLIVPTPEGLEAPGGYQLFSGRPSIEPPLRPQTRPVDPESPVVTIEPPQLVAPDGPVVVDPSLRGLRPAARPDDLAELNERAVLGGVSLAELSRMRPRIRPLVVERQAAQQLEQAEAERVAAAVAAAVAAEEVAAAEQAQQEAEQAALPASRLAVINSAAPRTRPNSIARIVRQAERDAARAETRVASIAPRTVQPPAPSRSSVAQAATQRNAINLRRVNLIGVYGKPSDRRALVRLKNGRFKKVKVGDRVDGGRVLAISDTQLRYQKGGRNVTLDLPQS
ncbi:hypothetical protein [Primorskyibacter sp. S187A]|uniref:hypothetical protein n=1 Tax=Primorskyibacter sp. S187A TaxID=3415130 RepID=UPI003C7A8E73